MIEIFLIVALLASAAINGYVTIHLVKSNKQTAGEFLVAMTDKDNHFLEHIEHLQSVNFQEAEDKRLYRERIARLQSERVQNVPITDNPHESPEDLEEFGGGNRRLT